MSRCCIQLLPHYWHCYQVIDTKSYTSLLKSNFISCLYMTLYTPSLLSILWAFQNLPRRKDFFLLFCKFSSYSIIMLIIQNSCLANSYFSKKIEGKEPAMGTVVNIRNNEELNFIVNSLWIPTDRKIRLKRTVWFSL